MLFAVDGSRLAAPVTRQKPNFVGPDGVNTTFLGFPISDSDINGISVPNSGLLPTTTTQCQNDASYPNFFGTSAATPHAAGIAALMLQQESSLTPAQIYAALQASALPMLVGSAPEPNFLAGYGFIQADAALAVPVLTLGATSIPLGSSTTLTWLSVDGGSTCTASGAWSGPQAASGSMSVTPTVAGSNFYTLACTNATGVQTSSTALLVAGSSPTDLALSLGYSSIVLGSSVPITWSSTNATGCTASGSWSGSLAEAARRP